MIKKDANERNINVCSHCGWFISKEELKPILGHSEDIYFCYFCGEKLKQYSPLSNFNYSDSKNNLTDENSNISDFSLEDERQNIYTLIRNESFNYGNIEKLAELIGIILGDGHVHKRTYETYKNYELSISLNRIDEKQYVKYVSELMYDIFKISPKLYPRRNSKGIDLKISNKSIVEWLITLGLKPGNKVRNQVNVPNWIKKDRVWIKRNKYVWIQIYIPLIKACLRGLFDTDGSIYINRRDKRIGLSFKNGSIKLVYDFSKMCNYLDIKTGKINNIWETSKKTGRKVKSFYVQIQAKDQLKKFIKMINPKKWEFNLDVISKKLSKLGVPIEKAFTYNWGFYEKHDATMFKQLYEELGDFTSVKTYLEKQGENPPDDYTISNHVKILFEEYDYQHKYGKNGYKSWISRNKMIIIDEQEEKVKMFQLNLKKFLTREIFKLFLINTNSVQDSLIQEYLKSVIINSGYERLTFLISDENKEKIILMYFIHLIRLVRYLFKYPEEMTHPSTIWRTLKLPFKQKHTLLIIEDLKNHFFN